MAFEKRGVIADAVTPEERPQRPAVPITGKAVKTGDDRPNRGGDAFDHAASRAAVAVRDQSKQR